MKSVRDGSLPKHIPRWIAHLYLYASLLVLVCFAQENQIQNVPKITTVSAMCTQEGITAQIMFDGPFYGKIYSHKYSTTHECVYYNNYGETMILFTIPNYLCGTRLSRNNQNVVNHIENEVYVQFDKDTQIVEDRRYLFICDLAPTIDFSGTVKPSQTVIIQTIEPTKIFATQTGGAEAANVFMSIQDGNGPFQAPVARPLKLGDVITLVVTGKSYATSKDYHMFVHTCYAADGTGSQKVELVDHSGCTVRPKLAGAMQRTRSPEGYSIYYFGLQAFKFPGSDDVYFSCSVDICASCNFQEICPDGRSRRTVATGNGKQLRYFQENGNAVTEMYEYGGEEGNAEVSEIQLHDYVRIVEEEDYQRFFHRPASWNSFCFSPVAVAGTMGAFAFISVALIAMTIFAISLVHRRTKEEKRCSSESEGYLASSTASIETTIAPSVRSMQHHEPWSSETELYSSVVRNNFHEHKKESTKMSNSPSARTSNRNHIVLSSIT